MTPEPVPLWDEAYARRPEDAYARLRAHGPVGLAELSPGITVHVVTDYRAALDLLHDTGTWSHDPRPWQETVPADAPVLGMLRWRPNVLFNDGELHFRYRTSLLDAFANLPAHDLRRRVEDAADTLMRAFGPTGEADLVSGFSAPLMGIVFNSLFGLPADSAHRLNDAVSAMMEGGPGSAAGEEAFGAYVMDLVRAKQRRRGQDLTSWLLDHPARLTPDEVTWQVFLTLGAGYEPTANLVANALSRVLSDPAYHATLTDGARPVGEAVADVLLHETPLANYGIHTPRSDTVLHGVPIPYGSAVLISYGAQAEARRHDLRPRSADDASHLSFGAGPHTCPVKHEAVLIATTAITRLLQWIPDLAPTRRREELDWRLGPFHRSLAALPVRFTPVSPHTPGAAPWTSAPRTESTPPEPTSQPRSAT
ncbi:cytochrome P450 [Streptomyces sp. NPDC092296]|uniref:cytochrome P450 n=1 Tax=Streptomyces sp. NPDC092296 TaxID=3366012 RepID=UPI00380D2170